MAEREAAPYAAARSCRSAGPPIPAERPADALGAAERAALRRELAPLGPPAGQQPGVARRTPADQERQRQLRGLGYTE